MQRYEDTIKAMSKDNQPFALIGVISGIVASGLNENIRLDKDPIHFLKEIDAAINAFNTVYYGSGDE